MAEEWGPWIEHDGRGCPPDLIGKFILAQFRLSHPDYEGGKPGQVHYAEAFVSEIYAGLPDWWRDRFGEIVQCPVRGEMYGVSDIERYRVRKPRALAQLRDIVESVPAPESEVA